MIDSNHPHFLRIPCVSSGQNVSPQDLPLGEADSRGDASLNTSSLTSRYV